MLKIETISTIFLQIKYCHQIYLYKIYNQYLQKTYSVSGNNICDINF